MSVKSISQLEESFRASQHVGLQERIFSNLEQCTRLLTIFHQKMVAQNALGCAMQKTDLGATGFTFLCSLSSFDFPLIDIQDTYLEFSAHPIDFVLKWEEGQLCHNERMCANFLKFYGFSTPTIVECQEGTSHSLVEVATRDCPIMEPISHKLALIAMAKFHASNFKHARDNGKMYRLSAEEQKRLFEEIARVVPFDFLIGNDDRVIRFKKDPENFFPDRPSFNKGNVMIEFINDRLHKVHFIDNCTTTDLSEKKQALEEEPIGFELMFGGGFVDEVKDEAQTTEKSPDYLVRLEQLKRIFRLAIQQKEKLVHHVSASFLAELDIQKLKISPEELESAVRQGIEKGIQQMKSEPIPSFEYTEDPFNLRAQELIRSNLGFIKEHQT